MVGVVKNYWSKLNQPYSNLYVKLYVFNRDLDVLANGYDSIDFAIDIEHEYIYSSTFFGRKFDLSYINNWNYEKYFLLWFSFTSYCSEDLIENLSYS